MQNPLVLHHEKMGADLSEGRVPIKFSSVSDEYWMLQKSTGFADLSHLGTLSVAGKDRLPFLNGLVTNDLANLPVNNGLHTLLLSNKARVVADLYLYNSDKFVLGDTGVSPPSDTKASLEKYIVTEDVKITDLTNELVRLTVQGPRSSQLIKTCLNTEVDALQHLQFQSVGPSFVFNRDRTGLGGYDLLLPLDETEAVWEAFLLKGGELGAGPVGEAALEVCRVEAGVPRLGRDVDQNTLVLEAGYADAISFRKGCYLGQEVVARASHIGRVNRKLVRFDIESQKSPVPGSKLSHENHEVGVVTSSVISPLTGRGVGLGYVARDFALEGTRLEIPVDTMNVSARVTKII